MFVFTCTDSKIIYIYILNQKKKSSKSKSGSSVKVANKKLNKYAKQGKLRKLREKQKKKELKQKRNHQIVDAAPTVNENENIREEETPLQEEDFSYFGSNVDGSSFITSVIKRFGVSLF